MDLVCLPDALARLEVVWDSPAHLRIWRFLSSISRVIIFDPRGLGVSDTVSPEDVGKLDDWVEDWLAVMDATGSERAVLWGEGYSGAAALLFSIKHPNRTRSLVLHNSFARFTPTANYPWGTPPELLDAAVELVEQVWGSGQFLETVITRPADDPALGEISARMERLSAPPATFQGWLRRVFRCDIRNLLGRVTCPTLVVHTGGPRSSHIEHSQYLADHIPGAKLVIVPPADSYFPIEPTSGAEIEEFITGSSAKAIRERELATILFSDIVESTTKAAEVGDDRWLTTLADIDAFVSRVIDRQGGRLIKKTGDGHLAIFIRPSNAVEAARAIRAGVRVHNVEMRQGLHTGEIEVRVDEDIGGIAVHIAARVMAQGGPGDILVSGAVPPLVSGSGIEFDDWGERELRGVPGTWRLYAVSG